MAVNHSWAREVESLGPIRWGLAVVIGALGLVLAGWLFRRTNGINKKTEKPLY